MKRTGLFFLFTILSLSFVLAQNAQDSLWIVQNYEKKEIFITMRDGVRLFTSIYLPKDTTEEHPILMVRTPYSCAPYGEDKWRSFWNSIHRYYMHEGYIMVSQDVRGRWMSEGEFMDVRPFNPSKKHITDIDEASDTYDAIDWLVKNLPNNNGRVGVWGISYPGFYSTMAALCGHPALKAVSPQAPVTDWFIGDDWHHNGTFFQMDAFSFYSRFGYHRPRTSNQSSRASSYPPSDNYEFFLETATLSDLAAMMDDSITFWKQMYQHPNYDTWWKARNVRNFVDQIPDNTATLVVGGLFDAEDCYGAWSTYEAIEKKAKNDNKLVMGPWSHGQWATRDGSKLGNIEFGSNTAFWYQNEIEIPFFNYYLKDKGSLRSLPEATIFFTGDNQWREFDQWPPLNKMDKPIYLLPGGKLGWIKPTATGNFTEYISQPAKPVPYTEDVHFNRTTSYMNDDQRFAARRPDVLVFESEELTEDLTLGGTVIADLLVSISSTDADFVVKLIDVFPETFDYGSENPNRSGKPSYPMGSYQMLVRGEIMQGKYRKSFENPIPFEPGKIEQVKFELPDVAHTFQKEHRIMIQIQSSWFPLADRNPQKFMNIYEASENDFQNASIRIYHEALNSSRIILPVMN
ncbi:MAG: CocE/NonD family hydrolase [Saprospiraceae bacterium]|nr:CocE/NonD family hydrolase [Saprospiraceae bacterium]